MFILNEFNLHSALIRPTGGFTVECSGETPPTSKVHVEGNKSEEVKLHLHYGENLKKRFLLEGLMKVRPNPLNCKEVSSLKDDVMSVN